ncbi:hypothetical protein CsSME_00001729 [Camellia sinensis var. sinensis]
MTLMMMSSTVRTPPPPPPPQAALHRLVFRYSPYTRVPNTIHRFTQLGKFFLFGPSNNVPWWLYCRNNKPIS